jgi:hypothetical protein
MAMPATSVKAFSPHPLDEHFRHQPSQSHQESATTGEPQRESSEPDTSWQTEPSEWEVAQPADRDSSYPDPFGEEPARSETVYTGAGVPAADIPNYLWPSIAVTLCCCAPLGIPAIVFASRVDAFKASGDIAAAQEASNKAKTWALASVGVAILVWIAIIVTGGFGAGA